MPQMAPLMWMNCLIAMSTMALIINTQNYFNKQMKTTNNKKMDQTSNNWKW